MTRTSELLESNFGMSLRQLNDPNIVIDIEKKIERERPPEFKYLSEYQKLNSRQQASVMEQQGHKMEEGYFMYKMAKAQEEKYCEREFRRVKRKLNVLEASDRETGVKFQYELDQDPNIHVLFIGNKNPRKPARYYKVKKSMIRFREMILEGNKKEYA